MTIHYVTGADRRLFTMACILAQSFSTWAPSGRLSVCDFGLTARQRTIFETLGCLIAVPATETHPWMGKASLIDYVRERRADCHVWLDADVLIVRPFVREIEAIACQMQACGTEVAACADSHCRSIDAFLEAWPANAARLDRFRRMLATRSVDGSLPYLNSGFFLCRSLAFLERWQELATQSSIADFLFEQNAFNVAAHGCARGCLLLEAGRWNVHGSLLSEVTTGSSGQSPHTDLTCRGLPVHVAHATGPEAGRDYVELECNIPHAAHASGILRLFVNPVLRRHQLQLLGDFRTAHAALFDGARVGAES
jgi:hypothetical protein